MQDSGRDMWKRASIGCAGLAVIGLTGCVSNPVTGSPELALVSESRLIAQAAIDYRREIERLRRSGALIERGADHARVQDVTRRLVAQAVALRPGATAWQWEVNLVKAPGIYNAWCMPGGKMLVYSGFLSRLKLTDDELAQLMAHEVSHALLSHGRGQRSIALLTQVASVAAAAAGVAPWGGADLATNLIVALPASRGDEAEADALGIELAARAGFDPAGATAVMAKILTVGSSRSRSDFWSTHPATVKRIEALARLRDSMEPLYLAARVPAAPVRVAGSSEAAGATDSRPPEDDGCSDLDSVVDRAECTGRLRLGLSLADVTSALGAPDEAQDGGRSMRYGDRRLEFDAHGRLVRITDTAAP